MSIATKHSIYTLLSTKFSTEAINILPKEYKTILTILHLKLGDITQQNVDIVVNAANKDLLPGGGVCGSIFRAARSRQLLTECINQAPCSIGEYKKTLGYSLPSKFIYHTVGPQSMDKKALMNCYKNCLLGMIEDEMKSIAFPCISTGIYGFPSDTAADTVGNGLIEWLLERVENGDEIPDRIILCCFLEKDYQFYLKTFKNLFDKIIN
ncbi:macro domain-like protein [Neoconidiobolus thromboides FSU 785]|nr:macro domain-like protein [Neoconidiobolus thromboides FSU 785]